MWTVDESDSMSDTDSGSFATNPRQTLSLTVFYPLPASVQTITRPRDESKEDKKARKAAVKADRQARRIDKKAMKEQFGNEMKAQMRTIGNKEKKMKKL